MDERASRRRVPAAWLLLWLLAGAPTLGAPSAQPVGQIVDPVGPVTVQRGKQPATKVASLFWLHTGDVVRVGDRATAQVVLFGNSARFKLEARSAVRVAPAALQPLSGPHPRPLGTVRLPAFRRIPARLTGNSRILGGMDRGGEDGPHDPVPDGAVRTAPVILRWSSSYLEEGWQLHLRIRDGQRAVHDTDLSRTAREYRVPDGVLHSGRTYIWSVAAVRDGRVRSCGARVRLLSATEWAQVAFAEKTLAEERALNPDAPAPLLLLAEVYEQYEMFDSARKAYQGARQLRPEDEGIRAALQRLTSER